MADILKNIMKKIVFFLVILGISGAGFFYWWQNQADVRELNKTLPEGVRVEKGFFNNEYKVVNKIDGYSFKVPPEWEGVEEIGYDDSKTDQGYTASSIGIEGNENVSKFIGIDHYTIDDPKMGLKDWAKNNFETFGLNGDFNESSVEGFSIIKTQENIHLGGMWIYFFKNDSAIYAIINGSEEIIEYIIANGQW